MIFWGSSLNSACQTLTVIRIRWQHKKDVFLGATWCSIIGLSIILNSSKKSVVPSKEAIKTTPKTSFTPNTHDIIATPLPRQQSYDASMGGTVHLPIYDTKSTFRGSVNIPFVPCMVWGCFNIGHFQGLALVPGSRSYCFQKMQFFLPRLVLSCQQGRLKRPCSDSALL